MKYTRHTRLQLRLQQLVFLLLFASVIGLLGWLSQQYETRFDLTSNQRHSLDPQSVSLLRQMPGPIRFHAYVREPETRAAVTEIIRRYQAVKPDFELSFYNPDLAIEPAKKDGVSLRRPVEFVIHYRGDRENITSLGENTLTNSLFRLLNREQQTIQFLAGHGERNPFADDRLGYRKLKTLLERKGLAIDTLNLIVKPVPETTRLLVIAAPEKDLDDGEVQQIQRYLDRGGNLLWLADPGELHGLQAIATRLGLSLLPGVVVDSNTNLRQSLNIQHPAIIPVVEYPDNVITARLGHTLFPISRGLAFDEQSDPQWQRLALLQSLPKSWQETGDLNEAIRFEPGEGDIAGPVTLGVVLQRQYGEATEKPRLQRIVVIGDSDFLADGYLGAGDNRQLALNLFNWLSRNDRALHIARPASHDRSLVLTDLELAVIAFGFFLILPALLLASGFWIRHRRKKRR